MAHAEQTLVALLKKIAIEKNITDYEIDVNELVSGGANYTSKLFTAVLKEKNKNDLHLFAKVAVLGEKFRTEMLMDVFVIERFVYTKLANIFESLENKYEVPEEHRLRLTKFYGSDITLYQETLVLENLFAANYKDHNRFESVNWEYASSAVRELAKFHALTAAYRINYPDDYENDSKLFTIENPSADTFVPFLQGSMASALKAVNEENKESLSKFFDGEIMEIFSMFVVPSDDCFLIHGDFRGSNLLHKELEDGRVDIKIVDFQTIRKGSPLVDLLYFIMTATDEQFRAEYYDKLVDLYYTELSAAMMRLHLNPEEIYSREGFYEELKNKLSFGLVLAVITLPVITVEATNAPKLSEDTDVSTFASVKTSDMYAERLNGVVNDYVKWGVLKK